MFKVDLLAFNRESNGFVSSVCVEMAYMLSTLKTLPDIASSAFTYGKDEVNKALQDCLSRKPDVICISILQMNYYESVSFINEIKLYLPDVHIAIFNKEASNYPIAMLQTIPSVDSVIIGEGEDTIIELIRKISSSESLDDCLGIAYKNKQGGICKNDSRPLKENLDLLPFPDMNLMKKAGNTYYITGSRGCEGHCSFCWTKLNERQPGSIFRARTMNSIADELKILKDEVNVKYLAFTDSIFLGNDHDLYSRCMELFDVLSQLDMDIRFTFNLRADIVDTHSIQALKQLLKVGLDRIFLGIESGNNNDLKIYGKSYNVSTNERCINLMHLEDIPFDYGFIMFNPYSSYRSLNENVSFIKKNELYPYMEKISSTLFIQSGTPIVRKLNNDGLLKCSPNKPIIDPWAFEYKNPKIKLIVNIMKKINKEFPFKKDAIVRAQSLLRNGQYKEKGSELIFNYENTLKNFLINSADFNLNLLQRIADMIFDNQEINEDFNYFENDQFNELIKMWERLNMLKNKLSFYMARRNKLYI